jgi:Na+-transporting NADH:ubiquinone oxidoreductase subunit NqrA
MKKYNTLVVFTAYHGGRVAITRSDIQRILTLSDPTHCNVIYHIWKDDDYVEETLTVKGTFEQVLAAAGSQAPEFVTFTFVYGLKVAMWAYHVRQIIDNGGDPCEIVYASMLNGTHCEHKYEVLGTFDQLITSMEIR